MRKIILSVAAAGAVLAAASPAAAQYYPQPQAPAYGYNNGYGNGYNNGFQGNWGQVRALRVRLEQIERQIDRLDRRDRIGDRSADRLRDEANRIERRLRDRARGGLNPYEMNDIQIRIARLEQRVQYSLANNNGYGRWGDRDGRWGDRDDRRDRD